MTDLPEVDFSPEDAQRLWGITPGMFNSYRMRDQLLASVQKGGKARRYTRFSVVQLCQLGVQLELMKVFKLSIGTAKSLVAAAAEGLAAEAAIEIEKAFSSPEAKPLPHILFAIVQCEPPKWFRIGLDDTVASVDARAGNKSWIPYDAREAVLKVCDFVIEQAGERPAFERWRAHLKARRS